MNGAAVIGIGIVVALVLASGKSSGSSNTADASQFLTVFYNWLWHEEGGLNWKTAGGDANLKRSPCLVNGVYPHTSRGITWTFWEAFCAFKRIPVECGPWLEFSALSAPNNLWKEAVTYRGRLAANFTSNQVLQRYIMLWYFGGWNQQWITPEQIREILNSSDDIRNKFRRLVNLRKLYFDKYLVHNPGEEQTVQHWQERAERAWVEFSPFT